MSYLYRKGYKQGSLKKKAPTQSILQGSPCRGPSAACTALCSDPARQGPAHQRGWDALPGGVQVGRDAGAQGSPC